MGVTRVLWSYNFGRAGLLQQLCCKVQSCITPRCQLPAGHAAHTLCCQVRFRATDNESAIGLWCQGCKKQWGQSCGFVLASMPIGLCSFFCVCVCLPAEFVWSCLLQVLLPISDPICLFVHEARFWSTELAEHGQDQMLCQIECEQANLVRVLVQFAQTPACWSCPLTGCRANHCCIWLYCKAHQTL